MNHPKTAGKTPVELSRRGFLAAGGASVLSCTATLAAPKHRISSAAPKNLQIGIIGCGQRGATLLRNLACLREGPLPMHVAAVCDASASRLERAAAVSSATPYRNWESLVGLPGLDGVVIASPDHWHGPMTLAALAAGKDVYCETPMALHAADAARVRNMALERGRIVQVGAAGGSEPGWQKAAALVQEGRLGAVRWCQAGGQYSTRGACTPGTAEDIRSLDWDAFLGPAPDRPFDEHRFGAWQAYRHYSLGPAAQCQFEALAPLLAALGPVMPLQVSAAGGCAGGETPDALVTTITYPGDLTMVLTATAENTLRQAPILRGARATLEVRGDGLRLTPEKDAAGKEIATIADKEPELAHLRNWLTCIRTREQCACGPQVACATQVAVCMAVDAYYARRTQRLS